MFRNFCMCALLLWSASAMAQMTPVGLWQTVSDADGKPQGEVRVTESGGVVSAVLEKALVTSTEPNCDKCTDDRKGKPKVGLQIIRDARKTEGKDVWEGGEILDPNNGKVYRAKAKLVDAGRKLDLRGYVGVPMMGRTQTWIREQ